MAGNIPVQVIERIDIDSRNIVFPDTTLFVALDGTKSNGIDFIPELIERGVRHFIVEEKYRDKCEQLKANFYLVRDPLTAWQTIVEFKRREYALPVIGITGSNGKTIVKEWLSQILTTNFSICKSPKSYNSQIGVPLSVWNLSEKNDLAIFEAGISKPKEMEKLEKMIVPTIGILTNIGDAHQANFNSVEDKLIEKLKLFVKSKILILPHDLLISYPQAFDELTSQNKDLKIVSWSEEDNAQVKVNVNSALKILILEFEGCQYKIPLKRLENSYIENLVHCSLTVLVLKQDLNALIPKISKLSDLEMRLELIEGIHDMTIINDTYNADMDSLLIAVQYLFAQTPQTKKSIILSEIQQTLDNANLRIYEILKDKNIAYLALIGQTYFDHADTFKKLTAEKISFYTSTEEFLTYQDASQFKQHTLLIKGARKFQLEKIVQQYRKKTHSTYLKVHLNALKNNLRVFTSLLKPQTKVMLMLKASGYGLGSIELARQLENERVDYYAVAYTDEAIELRNIGIQKPIMVLNPEVGALSKLIDYQLEPEVYSLGILKKLIEELNQLSDAKTISIHLKIETGMHRLGVTAEELSEVISLLKEHRQIVVKYAMTHLAASDDTTFDYFTIEQISKFQSIANQIEKELGYTFSRHALNTGGIIKHNAHQMGMVRLGIGLFGFDSTGTVQHQLQNTISLISRIAQIKTVLPTETVGYSRKGKVSRETKIAILNIGYADGYFRNFGNGLAQVYIKGQYAPTIGNICMDMTMIDITDCKNIEEGDEVELIGSHISAADLAAKANTISYEILTSISNRVQRVYWED
ncbi:MAG: bifunctional UDP-N-acetylmuramoyl-tripeptide:D-alanyl-D-alanine ligase/alanine racemase [Chitinophagales bacterium]|nr:bifunctional UDP-N-acetylmuramoyl-tripeptide:D-alanyl-D-alanine ligase/alanine racemase [Chitinophagales bacterium]